ncbi:MAG: hypothetical protein CMH32_06270 [Micavibrio sp.]|nr:hypothetical protein [Micavibrio sp.]HCK32110.1 hypothetical protein [Rhodospirillaceae bacterium]
MDKNRALTETLDVIKDDTSGQKINIGQLVEALEQRGFGPILMGLGLITVLPTGAIPFVPNICSFLLIMMAIQILVKKPHPWIPKKIKNFSFSREKFLKGIEIAKPYTKVVDQYAHPRLSFLMHKSLAPFMAILVIFLALAISLYAYIPFMAAIPALGVVLLGMAITAKDGYVLIISLILSAGSIGAIPYIINAVFDSTS